MTEVFGQHHLKVGGQNAATQLLKGAAVLPGSCPLARLYHMGGSGQGSEPLEEVADLCPKHRTTPLFHGFSQCSKRILRRELSQRMFATNKKMGELNIGNRSCLLNSPLQSIQEVPSSFSCRCLPY